MSTYLGNQLLSGVATNTISNAHSLFDFKWSDHILNEMSWLRADTFSWHNGLLYKAAYNHLVADYNNVQTKLYAWDVDIYTTSPEPSVGDTVYKASGASWGFAVSYVASDYSFIRAGGVAQLNRNPSIDIKTNTETIGSYTITYYLATDGHKIVGPDQETIANNIYNESGVAWYYVIDTTNTRFKLPRTKYGFVGLRDSVGKYVPESLPDYVALTGYNGTGQYRQKSVEYNYTANLYQVNAAATSSADTSYGSQVDILTYRPVQERATQMYLYFYVGQFSQTAIEQTAGLNSELFNGKVDIDLNNSLVTNSFATKLNSAGIRTVVESYTNGKSWYRIWSDGWIEQGGYATSGTVTLLKTYTNANYAIKVTPVGTNNNVYFDKGFVVTNSPTTTQFKVLGQTVDAWYWQAAGY